MLLAVLAAEQDLPEASRVLTEKYFSDLKKAGIGRTAFEGPLREHFEKLLDHLRTAMGGDETAKDPGLCMAILENIYRLIDWPQLRVLKEVISDLEAMSALASPMNAYASRDPGATLNVVKQQVERIRHKLDVSLPFDSVFKKARETTGAAEHQL